MSESSKRALDALCTSDAFTAYSRQLTSWLANDDGNEVLLRETGEHLCAIVLTVKGPPLAFQSVHRSIAVQAHGERVA